MADIGSTLSKYTSSAELSALLESDKFGIYSAETYLALDGITNDYTALYNLINTTINGDDAEIWFRNGTCLLSTSITIPSNIKLVFLNGAKIKGVTGNEILTIHSFEANLHQIFDNVIVEGLSNIEILYTEWWGAVQSLSSNPIDVTDEMNATFLAGWKAGGKATKLVSKPSGTEAGYWVTTLLLQKETTLFGESVDSTRIYQIEGTTTPCITDDPNTGAFGIRLRDFRVVGQFNNSNGIEFGFGSFVWGIQARMERMQISKFRQTGIKVLSSVTSLVDVTVLFCNIGYDLRGGSTTGYSLVADTCKYAFVLRGGHHNLNGIHYEGGKVAQAPVDFDLTNQDVLSFIDCVDSNVNSLTVLGGIFYNNIISFSSNTRGNSVENLKFPDAISEYTRNSILNDDKSILLFDYKIKKYSQGETSNIFDITDEDKEFGLSYSIQGESSNMIFRYVGSESNTLIRVPLLSDDVRMLTIVNASDVDITLTPRTSQITEAIFYGETTLRLPKKRSVTLINYGGVYNIISSDFSTTFNTTANRPVIPYSGQNHFDTTLNKPIWWNGTNWVDATGAIV